MNLATLEAARNAARETVAQHPDQAKIEALRERIVKLKLELKRSDRSSAQKATATAEFEKLEQERSALKSSLHKSMLVAQESLTVARRAARAQAEAASAAKLADVSTEELVQRRAALTDQRKASKRELRAVVHALGKRQAELRIKEMVAVLNDDDRRALLQELQVDGAASAEAVGTPGAS